MFNIILVSYLPPKKRSVFPTACPPKTPDFNVQIASGLFTSMIDRLEAQETVLQRLQRLEAEEAAASWQQLGQMGMVFLVFFWMEMAYK